MPSLNALFTVWVSVRDSGSKLQMIDDKTGN